MSIKTLDAIKGTHYEVRVTRDGIGDYEVEVLKPAASGDPYVEYELVSLNHLDGGSSEHELNKLVQRIIDTDHPSLVGSYKDYKDYKEEHNGN